MKGYERESKESSRSPILRRRQVAVGLAASQFIAPSLFAMGNHTHHQKLCKAPHSFLHTHKLLHAPAVIGRAKPNLPLIILDPGHGGKDPGAIGFSGTYEKHVAKAAALELRRQLLVTGRFRVGMTRTTDRFIPLEGRVEIAQKHRASLFMSIHADALPNATVRGASVYTHSRRASDKQTEVLAQSENSADRFDGSGIRGTSQEVRQILADLVTEESRRGSIHMALSVVAAFRSHVLLLHNPYRHAGFVVLKSASIPSVLVEMGFMSNRLDEFALRQAKHRALVASALCHAVQHYFDSTWGGLMG